jgi:hypothetical protein
MRPKQSTIPRESCAVDYHILLINAETLLARMPIQDAQWWPCRSLSLRLSTFQVIRKLNKPFYSYFDTKVDTVDPKIRSGSESPLTEAALMIVDYVCPHCNEPIPAGRVLEHLNRHVAVNLSATQT